MQYWLLKSEPGSWSWEEQVAEGEAGTEWDGVRNYQARNVMDAMSVGDRAFFYHSGKTREIVGLVEICAEAHPDSTDSTGTWRCVDVRAIGPMPRPLALAELRETAGLGDMVLLNNSRLSVQPVAPEEWRIICELGGWRD